MSDAREFLTALWDYKPEDAYMLIWSKQDQMKASHWCLSVDDALDVVERLRDTHDLYFGVSLSPADHGPLLRLKGGVREPAGLYGFWSDIDLAGEQHAKKAYPESLEEIRLLLTELGLPPTFLVHSGHGVQAHWVFKEPWTFDLPGECAEARRMSEQWSATVKAAARRHGWAVDSTFDLERVLRLPGTLNHKGEAPVEACILDRCGPRYNPSDFEDYLATHAPDVAAAQLIAVGDLEVDVDASPNFAKWEALCAIIPKARESWEHTRDDLTDASLSSYDLALANYAAQCDWPDQEIANLIIAHRRKYAVTPDDLEKGHRPDYLQRTIGRARMAIQKRRAENTVSEYYEEGKNLPGTASPPDREELLKHLSALLEVKVTRIIRYIPAEEYEIHTPAGEVTLTGVAGLIDQQRLRTAIATAARWVIPDFKGPRWRPVAQCLLDVCEDRLVGEEVSDSGRVITWIKSYLGKVPPVALSETSIGQEHPLERDGEVMIFLNDFRQWVDRQIRERITDRALAARMRKVGVRPHALSYVKKGRRTTCNVWIVPDFDACGGAE
jgi:hypothetical protein